MSVTQHLIFAIACHENNTNNIVIINSLTVLRQHKAAAVAIKYECLRDQGLLRALNGNNFWYHSQRVRPYTWRRRQICGAMCKDESRRTSEFNSVISQKLLSFNTQSNTFTIPRFIQKRRRRYQIMLTKRKV